MTKDTKKAGRKKLKGNKAESLNKLIQQKDLAWIEQEVRNVPEITSYSWKSYEHPGMGIAL